HAIVEQRGLDVTAGLVPHRRGTRRGEHRQLQRTVPVDQDDLLDHAVRPGLDPDLHAVDHRYLEAAQVEQLDVLRGLVDVPGTRRRRLLDLLLDGRLDLVGVGPGGGRVPAGATLLGLVVPPATPAASGEDHRLTLPFSGPARRARRWNRARRHPVPSLAGRRRAGTTPAPPAAPPAARSGR